MLIALFGVTHLAFGRDREPLTVTYYANQDTRYILDATLGGLPFAYRDDLFKWQLPRIIANVQRSAE